MCVLFTVCNLWYISTASLQCGHYNHYCVKKHHLLLHKYWSRIWRELMGILSAFGIGYGYVCSEASANAGLHFRCIYGLELWHANFKVHNFNLLFITIPVISCFMVVWKLISRFHSTFSKWDGGLGTRLTAYHTTGGGWYQKMTKTQAHSKLGNG